MVIRSPFTVDVALDHVEVDAAPVAERVRDRDAGVEVRDEHVRVLMHEHGVAAVAADRSEQPVRPVRLA